MTMFFSSYSEAVAALQERASQLMAGRPKLRALEAGAGKRTRLELPADAFIVGVDTDADALAKNDQLHERVVSDVVGYTSPPRSFDVITCWYVMEHVDEPPVVLDRFAEWLAPGGFIALAVPNLGSPKAIFTKFSPHWTHVWFRKHVAGVANAGKPGYGPYPTTLRRSIAPVALRRWAANRGLEIAFEGYFEDEKQLILRKHLRLTGAVWRALNKLTTFASFGRLDLTRTELVMVIRRPDSAAKDAAA